MLRRFRSRANSLPGANRPIGPWPIRSLAISLPGTFAPWSEMAGPFAPGNESSCELSLPGTLVPGTFPTLIQNITMRYATYSRLMALLSRAGPFRSRERKFQGAKWPGSEWARERKGQGAKGPGSELARFLLADSLLGAN